MRMTKAYGRTCPRRHATSVSVHQAADGDGLDLATAGWMAACLLFLAIGILTPVDMRYYLAALPESFNITDAVKHVNDANDAAWKIVYGEAPFIRKLLTPGQVRRLTFGIREMVISGKAQGRFFFGNIGRLVVP